MKQTLKLLGGSLILAIAVATVAPKPVSAGYADQSSQMCRRFSSLSSRFYRLKRGDKVQSIPEKWEYDITGSGYYIDEIFSQNPINNNVNGIQYFLRGGYSKCGAIFTINGNDITYWGIESIDAMNDADAEQWIGRIGSSQRDAKDGMIVITQDFPYYPWMGSYTPYTYYKIDRR